MFGYPSKNRNQSFEIHLSAEEKKTFLTRFCDEFVNEKSILNFPTPEVDPANPMTSPEAGENVGTRLPVPPSSSAT